MLAFDWLRFVLLQDVTSEVVEVLLLLFPDGDAVVVVGLELFDPLSAHK